MTIIAKGKTRAIECVKCENNFIELIKDVASNMDKTELLSDNPISRSIEDETKVYTTHKEFLTGFADEKLLQKTLKEYGCTNFRRFQYDFFICTFENIKLEFLKLAGTNTYKMTLKSNDATLPFNFVNELLFFYLSNSQEFTYNKILKNIAKKHLNLISEELHDDDSITLTVGVD